MNDIREFKEENSSYLSIQTLVEKDDKEILDKKTDKQEVDFVKNLRKEFEKNKEEEMFSDLFAKGELLFGVVEKGNYKSPFRKGLECDRVGSFDFVDKFFRENPSYCVDKFYVEEFGNHYKRIVVKNASGCGVLSDLNIKFIVAREIFDRIWKKMRKYSSMKFKAPKSPSQKEKLEIQKAEMSGAFIDDDSE